MNEKPASEADALSHIEAQMRFMLDGSKRPYDAGWEIWRIAMSTTDSPDVLHPLWLIWGSLTDWIEQRPEDQGQAEEAMLRAAREWLMLADADQPLRDAYLDRWVYAECGYERKT